MNQISLFETTRKSLISWHCSSIMFARFTANHQANHSCNFLSNLDFPCSVLNILSFCSSTWHRMQIPESLFFEPFRACFFSRMCVKAVPRGWYWILAVLTYRLLIGWLREKCLWLATSSHGTWMSFTLFVEKKLCLSPDRWPSSRGHLLKPSSCRVKELKL